MLDVLHFNTTVFVVPNIATKSLMNVTQILAIFSGLFDKSTVVYFQSKTFFL